mgnify:CR=1 FL=1
MSLTISGKFNITLCGMMGSGKSTLGKILARKIGYNFIDIDKLIEEKTKKSINKIFEEDGENYFREVEEKITLDILKKHNTVVSLGGGAVINKNISNIIKMNSYNIYLEVNINVLGKRLKKSKNRPLIIKKDINKTLEDLLIERESFYKKADLIIKNESNINNTIKTIIKSIINE